MTTTISSLAREMEAQLTPALGSDARPAARNLICDRLGLSFTAYATRLPEPVSEADEAALREWAKRVADGEPVQYVTGEGPFGGFSLHVESGVLIPRPETEGLVERIISWADGRTDLRAIDLGTGSGCIAIALARGLVAAEVMAVDASDDAIRIAQGNADRLAPEADIFKVDLLSSEADDMADDCGPFDIVVSNPPYIRQSERKDMAANVLDHEPEMALFVPDADPLLFYRRIGQLCIDGLLDPDGGALFFEINEALGHETAEMLRGLGFAQVSVEKDYLGKDRYVIARINN